VGGHLFLEPNEDVQIEDVSVPKGTPILVLNGYVGTQGVNFSRAEEFRPERWLKDGDDRTDEHNIRAFMPFGAGPRFCPGRQLAMLQIKMVTAMLGRDFDVVRPEGAEPVDDIYNFTVGPTHFSAIMRPRRPVRLGIDIDFRQRDRRMISIPVSFPERRVADRRKASATGH
jgi:cytochrome P450